MTLNSLKKRVMGVLMALSLLAGIGITSSMTAQAQWRGWERRRDNDWRYNRGSFELRQTALNAGYNEGIKEGRKDRQRGDRFEYRDEEDFRNANTDYNSRYGNRELYRQYFRQGFINGYTDGYRGY
jgi:hypothetical protein